MNTDSRSSDLITIVGWAALGMSIVGAYLLIWWQADVTTHILRDANERLQNAQSPKILPKNIRSNETIWEVARSDTIELRSWGVKFTIPKSYAKKVAYIYNESKSSYRFASVDALLMPDCQQKFYRNEMGQEIGLGVTRYNGAIVTFIGSNTKQTTLDKYYAQYKVADQNYFVAPDELGSWRRYYKVGDYYFHDESNVLTYNLTDGQSVVKQQNCKNALMLEADKSFVDALSSLEQL
ncbi:MAG: hypothetical protein WBB39_01285 [Candidatus Saccharimonadales bacterium]